MEENNQVSRCKSCNHLESFHSKEGCNTWLLGVRAVPLYRCACVMSSEVKSAFTTNPKSTEIQENLSKEDSETLSSDKWVKKFIPPINPPLNPTIFKPNPYNYQANFGLHKPAIPSDFYTNYPIHDWRQASSMLFGRIQNNMCRSKKEITQEQNDELVALALLLRKKMNEYFTDEGIA